MKKTKKLEENKDKTCTNLKLLYLSGRDDDEGAEVEDLEENKEEDYFDFYDDIKSPHKYIKEDW